MVHCLSRLPLDHRRKATANESRSFPPSQPPAFPLGNDDQRLAAAVRHQYAFNPVLALFILYSS